MKKLNLLLFIAITSLFISCDKDEDAVVIDEAAFSGEWQMTGYEITDAETTFDFLGETFTVSTATTGKDFDYTLTVTDNPNLITGEGSFTTTKRRTLTIVPWGKPWSISAIIREKPKQDTNKQSVDTGLKTVRVAPLGEFAIKQKGTGS